MQLGSVRHHTPQEQGLMEVISPTLPKKTTPPGMQKKTATYQSVAKTSILSHGIHIWYICVHLPYKLTKFQVNIPYMDGMGI